MKYLKPHIIVLLIVLFFTGCGEDFVTLENKNVPTIDNYYNTTDEIVHAVNIAYSPLMGRGMYAGTLWNYFYGGHEDIISEFNFHDVLDWTQRPDDMSDFYSDIYKGLFRCNLTFEKLEDNPDTPEDLAKRLRGEALFLRAMYHFISAVQFGNAPIADRIFTPNDYVTNATPQEKWEFAATDLREIIDNDLLPRKGEYASRDVGRATLGAAYALLGKIYVYLNDWANAAQYLNAVISSEDYSLVTPQVEDSAHYVLAFNSNFTPFSITIDDITYGGENNEESVFEVQYNGDGGTNRWLPGWQSAGGHVTAYIGYLNYNNFGVLPSAVEEFSQQASKFPEIPYDPRMLATIYQDGDVADWRPGNQFSEEVYHEYNARAGTDNSIKKYFYPPHTADEGYINPNNIRLIRYSDVLLLCAEAEYHLGRNTEAMAKINQVRARAGMPDVTEVTPEVIMHERYVELFGEGIHLHDLIRWSLLDDPWVNVADLIPTFVKGQHEYFPMPGPEIDIMAGTLEQNPGW